MSYRKHLMTMDETPSELYKATEVGTDCISRQAAIDAARDWYEGLICGSFKGLEKRLRALPPAQPEAKTNVNGDWVILNKDKILKAGMEGREVDFRIGGRLFAIREKAQ